MDIILEIILYPVLLLIGFLGPLLVPLLLFFIFSLFRKNVVDDSEE